jgi:SAM-dependent methyltransferase
MDPAKRGLAVAATDTEKVVEQVRDRYAKIAEGKLSSCCGTSPCGGGDEAAVAASIGYGQADLSGVPEGANLGLGCGAPIDHLKLQPGERVLDLGSGAGIDVFLAARRVGPTGHAIGVDMTPEMLAKARANAEKMGVRHVEFRQGRLENLPVEAGTIDAVTSNCVINLVPDKPAVFREVARVLKPGGRLVISDIILDGRLPAAVEKDVYAYVGCISGAMERNAYFGQLRDAGLTEIEVLKDIDYLAAMADAAPQEVQALLERTGVTSEQVIGKVRSVTYRASKPAAASCCGPSCCAGSTRQ